MNRKCLFTNLIKSLSLSSRKFVARFKLCPTLIKYKSYQFDESHGFLDLRVLELIVRKSDVVFFQDGQCPTWLTPDVTLACAYTPYPLVWS